MPQALRSLPLFAVCLLLGCKPAEPAPAAAADPGVESKAQLADLYERVSAYYGEQQQTPEGPAMRRQCPSDGRPKGESGITPPLSVKCAAGPEGRCVPGGTGPGAYPASLWTDNEVWKALGFELSDPHRFHYNLLWSNSVGRFSSTCTFTIQAFADLDDDGIYSTYERFGRGGDKGVESVVGLYIDQKNE